MLFTAGCKVDFGDALKTPVMMIERRECFRNTNNRNAKLMRNRADNK
jgi:hypothetical protein